MTEGDLNERKDTNNFFWATKQDHSPQTQKFTQMINEMF